MGKTRFNIWLRNIWIIIVIVGVIAGVATTFAITQIKADNNADDIADLEKRGCSPAQELKTQVAVIQTDIKYIMKGVDSINEKLK